jgi:hypothetical protein
MQYADLPYKSQNQGSLSMKSCICIAIFLMCAIFAVRCSNPRQVSGIEITNGNCVGKIYHSDGSAAGSALVRLIPSGYNPYSQTNASIDSTYTNSFGDYSFLISQPDYYNIVAEKGSTSCLQDSIYIQGDAKTIIDNDTLRESGTLSGSVRLKPGDDSRSAVILIVGTNVYTTPSDSLGNFETPLLPKGTYRIQIFSTLTGYAVFDTNVTISEGADTKINVILPSSNAPSIAKLSTAYDSATMFTSLSWPMPDTSEIVSYALYRKSRLCKDTMWVLDKSVRSFTDDIVGLDGDTVSYEIAGIGKNYKEGYRTKAQEICVCGKVYCIKKIDLTLIAAGLPHLRGATVFSDRENEIFLVGTLGIYKLDSSGVVLKDYFVDNPDPNSINSLDGYLQSDDLGRLYIHKFNYNHPAVIKFDRDLNVLAEIPLDTGFENLFQESIEVAGNGTIFTFNISNDSALGYFTDVTVYDSTPIAVKDFRVMNREMSGAQRFGDTIVTYEYHTDEIAESQIPYIHFYDSALRQLSVFKPIDLSPRFCSTAGYSAFIAASHGVFMYTATSTDGTPILLFTTSGGEFLARIMQPDFSNIFFDSNGNVYFVTYHYSFADDVSDNPMKTLFIYTLAPLFKSKMQ